MWRGFPQAYAEERARALAEGAVPGARVVVRDAQLRGIEWEVRLWVFDEPQVDPREALARLRATDGEPLGFETLA